MTAGARGMPPSHVEACFFGHAGNEEVADARGEHVALQPIRRGPAVLTRRRI